MTVHNKDFDSKVLTHGEYDDETETLKLWFHNKEHPYYFYGVPKEVWEDPERERSPGSWYNFKIRGVY